MTLLQGINQLIDNISVTDKQENSITASINNLDGYLLDKDNDLHIDSTFRNGSYERDTIIRPLDDIDVFAVLNRDKWKDEFGNLPTPQSVLTKLKNYLNGLTDYEGTVSQDRPCVTIRLSDKDFDVLPSFRDFGGGYLIPNYDLSSWIYANPELLTTNLDSVNRLRNYKVKPTIKAVKYWNRDIGKLIPSYHIEEVAISIFQMHDGKNQEEMIRCWFENAVYYLRQSKFKSENDYTTAIKKIEKTRKKLKDAKGKYDNDDEAGAKLIWKEVFGKEFPAVDAEEVKNFTKSLAAGTMRVGATGLLSETAGSSIRPSKGYFGDHETKTIL
ncbi:MAG: hypothetical protein HYU71_15725 [Bacteroidetes bacterium]|nr:hypothetical protein [Bacteroidota bacterium]